MKAYLISLSGQDDDREYKLVGQDVFEWLTSRNHPTPPSLLNDEEIEIPKWHGSSPDNDRALVAKPEYGEVFWYMKDLLAWIKKNDVEVVDVYEGVIY